MNYRDFIFGECDEKAEEMKKIKFYASRNLGTLYNMHQGKLCQIFVSHEEEKLWLCTLHEESGSEWHRMKCRQCCYFHTWHINDWICLEKRTVYEQASLGDLPEILEFLKTEEGAWTKGRTSHYTMDDLIFFYEEYGVETRRLKPYLEKKDRLKRFAGNINFKFEECDENI